MCLECQESRDVDKSFQKKNVKDDNMIMWKEIAPVFLSFIFHK